jgi:hypothetical protein
MEDGAPSHGEVYGIGSDQMHVKSEFRWSFRENSVK